MDNMAIYRFAAISKSHVCIWEAAIDGKYVVATILHGLQDLDLRRWRDPATISIAGTELAIIFGEVFILINGQWTDLLVAGHSAPVYACIRSSERGLS